MTYRQKKAHAWDTILTLAYAMWDGETSRYWSEVAEFTWRIERIARRYGLLKQCREEGIL